MGINKRQIHGGDIYRNPHVTDFSVNSNPLGIPEAVLQAVRMNVENMVHYPDVWCTELRKAIGDFEKTEMEHILCGNGAAELFFCCSPCGKTRTSTFDSTGIFGI